MALISQLIVFTMKENQSAIKIDVVVSEFNKDFRVLQERLRVLCPNRNEISPYCKLLSQVRMKGERLIVMLSTNTTHRQFSGLCYGRSIAG